MGLLSSWSFEGLVDTSGSPPPIAATILLPEGPALSIVVAHAPPPTMGSLRTGPRYDPTNRDLSIEWLRQRIGPSLEAGDPIVLLGDFNVTDREVGYGELSDGLTDSYRTAGSGWGHPWRPPRMAGLPFGLLRVDLALAGPQFMYMKCRATAAAWFSTFLEKPLVSRVKRRMRIRINVSSTDSTASP